MTDSDLATRFAMPNDLDLVTELLLATGRHYWGPRDDLEPGARRSAEALLGGEADCRILLGFRDGIAVAYATVAILYPAPSDRGTLFMKDLFVTEAARSQGTGEAMLRVLAKLAHDRGCARFDWTAETDNPRALAFYDRLAAQRITEKVYYRFAHDALARFAQGSATPDANEGAD